MAKAEIEFEYPLEDASARHVYVAHNGGRYRFFSRARRYDHWEPVKEPPLQDWLELLDCVRRRIARGKLMLAEEKRVLQCIQTRFPEYKTISPSKTG